MKITWSEFKELTELGLKDVPNNPGVYLLWVKLENGNWRCYYIGQAQYLGNRLSQHLSKDEENLCVKNHISKHTNGFEYAVVANQSERDGIERYLYDHFKPECGEKCPDCKPIVVNLP